MSESIYDLTPDQFKAYFDSLGPNGYDAIQASNNALYSGPAANSGMVTDNMHTAGATNVRGKTALQASAAQNALQTAMSEKNWTQGSGFDQFMATLTPMITAAGLGAAFAPAAIAAVGAAPGGIAAGGITGGIAGGAGAGLTGQNVLKGAALGAAGGALGSAAKPIASSMTSAGVNPLVASGLVKTGAGAITGGIGGAVSGQGVGAGALSGAEHAAISAGSNAVTGSIFNSGNTVIPANNMSDDGLDYITPTAQYMGDPYGTDPLAGVSNPGYENFNVQGGGSTLGGGYTDANGNTTAGNLTGPALAKFLTSMGIGGVSGGGGSGGGNGSLLGSLASMLTGGGNSALLGQLLGMGATTGGNYLSLQQQKDATANYANQAKFSPYSVNGPNGSTSFNGTSATSTLSPQQQAIQKMLGGLGTSSGNALAAGPQGAINSNFNALQSADLQAQQRLLGNTQDNQFANGILGSTAGGYQTQGALQAIGAQTGQNYSQAVNQANTQQQQQLAQLTGSLNGMGNINSQALAQLGLGASIGTDASKANAAAYAPSVNPNSVSLWGNTLQGLGNSATNNPYPWGP